MGVSQMLPLLLWKNGDGVCVILILSGLSLARMYGAILSQFVHNVSVSRSRKPSGTLVVARFRVHSQSSRSLTARTINISRICARVPTRPRGPIVAQSSRAPPTPFFSLSTPTYAA